MNTKYNNAVSSKNIVINPISGRTMLGKNLDNKQLNISSLRDRHSSQYPIGDRVKMYLKENRNSSERYLL